MVSRKEGTAFGHLAKEFDHYPCNEGNTRRTSTERLCYV